MVNQPQGSRVPESARPPADTEPRGSAPPSHDTATAGRSALLLCPGFPSAKRVAASAACLQMQALQDPLNCVLVQKRL